MLVCGLDFGTSNTAVALPSGEVLAPELERRGAELSSHLWSASLITDDPEAIIAVQRSTRSATACGRASYRR